MDETTLIANERAKLAANLLNSLASSTIIAGVVAPLVATIFDVAGASTIPIWLKVISIAI